jgi:4-hydroxy-tetrahydrodipicolinate synthase
MELIKVAKKAVDVPIIAGVGTNNTHHTINLTKDAIAAGADALLVVTPYYNRPAQSGIIEHFKEIAKLSDLPIIVYDIPGRTGVELKLETLLELSKIPNIIGVKDATGASSAVRNKILKTNLQWYCGDDALNYSMMASGACGCISVVSHIMGNEFLQMAEYLKHNNHKEALTMFDKTLAYIDKIMGGGQGAAMVKAALEKKGVLKNRLMRLPVVKATDLEVMELLQ